MSSRVHLTTSPPPTTVRLSNVTFRALRGLIASKRLCNTYVANHPFRIQRTELRDWAGVLPPMRVPQKEAGRKVTGFLMCTRLSCSHQSQALSLLPLRRCYLRDRTATDLGSIVVWLRCGCSSVLMWLGSRPALPMSKHYSTTPRSGKSRLLQKGEQLRNNLIRRVAA